MIYNMSWTLITAELREVNKFRTAGYLGCGYIRNKNFPALSLAQRRLKVIIFSK